MSKTESLMGSGTLQTTKSGFFGTKSFEAKYQFQLVSDDISNSGIITGFVRIDENQKINTGSNYLLTLDDNRKSNIQIGPVVANIGGLITYSISGQIKD